MNEIIRRINSLRERKGWSQYELAKVTGISPNAVYSWMRTGTVPSLSNVERVCEAADITIDQFFSDADSCEITEEEKKLLNEWVVLSELEKEAILKMIEVFKELKL